MGLFLLLLSSAKNWSISAFDGAGISLDNFFATVRSSFESSGKESFGTLSMLASKSNFIFFPDVKFMS